MDITVSIGVNTYTIEPDGVFDLVHRRYFSDTLSGYLDEINGNLVIYGEVAEAMRQAAKANLCSIYPVTIIDNDGLNLTANIYANDIEFNLSLGSANVQLVDAGFLSLIDNNMAIKSYLHVPISKNGVDITAQTNVTTTLKLWDSSYLVSRDNRKGVKLFDAFTYLIAFMTDGAVGFVSDYFTNDAVASVTYLTTALALRDNTVEAYPLISFQELYVDQDKIFNLAFNLEYYGGLPFLRIEPKSYFRTQSNSITCEDAHEVTQQADATKLYTLVKFGSAKEIPTGPIQSDTYPFVPFYNQKTEEYFLGGNCNRKDVSLDLKLDKLVTDMSIIFGCFPVALGGTADDSYDDDVLLLQFRPNLDVAWFVPVIGLLDIVSMLNEGYTQWAISTRYFGFLPNSIFNFLGMAQEDAMAFSNADQVFPVINTLPIIFGNDSINPAYDPNGNMSQGIVLGFPATFYTVPTAGVYTTDLSISFLNALQGITVVLQRRDSSNVLQEQQVFVNTQPTLFTISWQMICDTGDIIVCFAQQFVGTLFTGSSFRVRALYSQFYAGGEWAAFNANDMDIMLTKFQYPLTFGDWTALLNGFNSNVVVTYDGGVQIGYPKDVSRNLITGEATLLLMGKFLLP